MIESRTVGAAKLVHLFVETAVAFTTGREPAFNGRPARTKES
jgi:hypothetical protein